MNDESPNHTLELITVPLSAEELAAVEGWRLANRFKTRSAAMRQLVRLGLLSEIGRLYQSVAQPADES